MLKFLVLNNSDCWHKDCSFLNESGGSMAKGQFQVRAFAVFFCAFALVSFSTFAAEYAPTTFSGGSRQSDFQMQQAQEAIRSICGCVVGSQTLNPNCGPLTASALQQPQAGMNGQMMGMPAGMINGGAAVHGGGALMNPQPQPGQFQNMPPGSGNPFQLQR